MSSSFFTAYELTGKTRLNSERRWGRERLVLQVQERGNLHSNIGGRIDTETVTRWRNATTADLPLGLEVAK